MTQDELRRAADPGIDYAAEVDRLLDEVTSQPYRANVRYVHPNDADSLAAYAVFPMRWVITPRRVSLRRRVLRFAERAIRRARR